MPSIFTQFFDPPTPDVSQFLQPETISPIESEVRKEYVAARVALLDQYLNPGANLDYAQAAERSVDLVDSAMAADVERIMDGLASQALQLSGDQSLFGSALRAQAAPDEESQQEVIELEAQRQADLMNALGLTPAHKLSRATQEALLDLALEESSTKRGIILEDAMNLEVGERLEAMGFNDTWEMRDIGNFAELIIPGRMTYGISKGGAINPFKDIDSLEKRIKEFRSMSREEQLVAWPQELDRFQEMSGGNPFIFSMLVHPYFNFDEGMADLRLTAGLDIADLGATLISVGIRAAKAVRGQMTPVKMARDVGNTRRAAELLDAAAGDTTGRVNRVLNVSRIEALASVSPFQGEKYIPYVTDGLAADVQKVIAERIRAVNGAGALQDLMDGDAFIRRSPLTAKEQEAAIQKYLTQFAGEARVTKRGPFGFQVEVTIQPPKGKWDQEDLPTLYWNAKNARMRMERAGEQLEAIRSTVSDRKFGDLPEVKRLQEEFIDAKVTLRETEQAIQTLEVPKQPKTVTKTIVYRENDVGKFDAIEYSGANRFLNSPYIYVNQMLEGIVDQATAIDYNIESVRKALESAARKATKGIKGKRRRNVDSVLLQGDKDQIARYSTADLLSGIRTEDGLVRFETAEEIAAYHSMRDIYDALYALKNRTTRRELEFQGFKYLPIKIGKDTQRAYAKPEFIFSPPKQVTRMYDQETGKVVDVSSIMNFKDKVGVPDKPGAWGIVKLKDDLVVPRGKKGKGNEIIQYAFVKRTSLRELPNQVLTYRAGYVPLIRPDAFYLVRRLDNALLNGRPINDHDVIEGFFTSKAKADAYADAQKLKGKQVKVEFTNEYLDAHPKFREDLDLNTFGGLYSKDRVDVELPLDGEFRNSRMGAFEAMEAYVNHMSTRMPLNEFRMGMIKRFLNSARDPLTGKSYLADPSDYLSDITGLSPASKQYSGLKAMQDWIKDQLRIPSTGERRWGDFMRRVAEWMDGSENLKKVPGMDTLRMAAIKMGNKDPFAAARAAAFHALLGWFNPVQIFVQSMGAAMAFSLDPINGPRRAALYLALRTAMFTDSSRTWAMSAEALAKSMPGAALKRGQFEELVRGFRRSGLFDSIRTTADYAAAMRGAHIGPDALKRAADKGLVFFREGELLARGYAWIQSFEKFMKGKGANYILKDTDIDAITAEALRYTMNMNRANRAFWQKGALSIPTQFMQVTAKFIENMYYPITKKSGTWSKADKARIATGQLVLFGAAGVPFGNWAISNLMQWLGSEEDYGMGIKDPDTLAAVRGGLLEFMVRQWTGEDIAIAQRSSIPNGIETFAENMTKGDIGQALAGAFGEIPRRTFQALSHIGPILASPPMEAWDADMAAEVAQEAATIISTYRNFHIARIWHEMGKITTNDGIPLMDLDEDGSPVLIFSKAVGLQPRLLDDFYSLREWNNNVEKAMQDATDAWEKIALKYARGGEKLQDPNYQARYRHMLDWVLAGFTQAEREIILKRGVERLKNRESAIHQEMVQALENLMITEGDTTTGVIRGNIELNSLFTEEQE